MPINWPAVYDKALSPFVEYPRINPNACQTRHMPSQTPSATSTLGGASAFGDPTRQPAASLGDSRARRRPLPLG